MEPDIILNCCPRCHRVEVERGYWVPSAERGRNRLQQQERLKESYCPRCIEQLEHKEEANG